MSNHLDVFCNYLLLTSSAPDISTEVFKFSLGFSFYKKITFCSPEYYSSQNILGSRNGKLTLENAARVYTDYKQNVPDRFHSLMSVPAIIIAATVKRVETDFHELVFSSMTICHYVTMLMLVFKNGLSTSILTIFCVPSANRCPENAKPVPIF